MSIIASALKPADPDDQDSNLHRLFFFGTTFDLQKLSTYSIQKIITGDSMQWEVGAT